MLQPADSVPTWALAFIAVLIMLTPSVLFLKRPWLFFVLSLTQFSVVLCALFHLSTALYLFAAYLCAAYLLRLIIWILVKNPRVQL